MTDLSDIPDIHSLPLITRIELTLEQMGMTRDELRELIEAILGLGKGTVSVEEEITVAGDDGAQSLDGALTDVELEELFEQLDFLQRLRALELKGHALDPLELEMLLQAGQSARIDTKTLELVVQEANAKELRKRLALSQIRGLGAALTNMESAAALGDTIASSGDTATQQKLLNNLAEKHLPKGKTPELGKGNTLYVKNEESIQKTTKSTVKTLLRLDYQSDIKRMVDETKKFLAKLKGERSEDWHKGGIGKQLDDGDEGGFRARVTQEGESIVLDADAADQATEKDQKRLKVLDYASDMKRMFKNMKTSLFGSSAEALAAKNDGEWSHDSDGLQLGDPDEVVLKHGAEEAADIVMTQEGADQETNKDQKKLQALDHQGDLAKMMAKHRNPAMLSAHNAMKNAEHIIKADNLEDTKDIAVAISEGLDGVRSGGEADMKDLKTSLEQTKDHADPNKGREIS